MRQGLNVNSKDKRESTPLHWAAFAGAELTLSFIVAYTSNVNEPDARGLSPLHLAVKSCEDLRSTKALKALLIKGADRNAVDINGKRPIDLLADFRDT